MKKGKQILLFILLLVASIGFAYESIGRFEESKIITGILCLITSVCEFASAVLILITNKNKN